MEPSIITRCADSGEEAGGGGFLGGQSAPATTTTTDAAAAPAGRAVIGVVSPAPTTPCSLSSSTSSTITAENGSSSTSSSSSSSGSTVVSDRDPPGRVRADLFIGSRETEAALGALRAAGVTHVVQAGGELAPSHAGELEYLQLPLADADDDDAVGLFARAFAFIDAGRKKGAVLVHCAQGMSRSGAIAVGYLMWRERLSLDTALAHVQRARAVVDPNEGFRLQLKEFERLGCDLAKWQGWDKQQLERCFRRSSISGRCVVRGLRGAVRRFHVCDVECDDGDTVFDVAAVLL